MKIIGHRGARGLAPENTLISLRKAIEHKVDMVEFDVRVTKDNKVILNHNPYIRDAANNKLVITKHSYKELREHKPDLPTLTQALQVLNGKVPIYLEVKPRVDTKPVIRVLKEVAPKGLWLASKSQKVLRELHAAFPETPKIVIEPWSGVRAHLRAHQVGTKVIAMNKLWLWWGFIRGFKNSDWQLYAYTLNNPAKAKRWQRWGLSGVVTDYPDLYNKLK